MNETATHARTMEDIAGYIAGMRFKRKLFGGVDEADVWKQIEALHKEYEAVFLTQEMKYQALMQVPTGVQSAPSPTPNRTVANQAPLVQSATPLTPIQDPAQQGSSQQGIS